MNVYPISPKVVRINLNKQLNDNFVALDKRLQWTPLTVNLDKCEEKPYLYFRITLKTRQSSNTYIGFATGTPFMLSRGEPPDGSQRFFLRHWVRKEDMLPKQRIDSVTPEHMSVGYHEDSLIVRVNIDRPLVKSDTFKSIPFATMMFQIVQIDAFIEELPHVRMAFAIERTLSPEELALLQVTPDEKSSTTSTAPTRGIAADIKGKTPTTAAAAPLAAQQRQQVAGTATVPITNVKHKPPPAVTPPSGSKSAVMPVAAPAAAAMATIAQQGMMLATPVQTSTIQQAMVYRAQPANVPIKPTPAGVSQLPNAQLQAMFQHNPYNYNLTQQVPIQVKKIVPPRPVAAKVVPKPANSAQILPARPAPEPVQKATFLKPSTSNPTVVVTKVAQPATNASLNHMKNAKVIAATAAISAQQKAALDKSGAHAHPDVRIWEEHDANDPYEPLIITEDAVLDSKLAKKIIIDHSSERRDRFDYNELFGFCSSDFPEFYLTGPDVHTEGDEEDVEVVVNNASRDKYELNRSHVTNGPRKTNYLATVAAAATYNSVLGEERYNLKQWLVEDAERQESRNDDDDDEDDGDSMSEG